MRQAMRIAGRVKWVVALAGLGLVLGATNGMAEPRRHPHAGVSFVPMAPVAPGLPTLSSAPPVALEKAFGSQDEDCIYEIKGISRPGAGTLHRRKLICRE
jgi:hypothetical protein